ncbi:RlpA-like double-psi beta-barrel-protein domain-containing protein-containing protein [Lentinula lateritia]|nr:RlpA-like double-psi beta-barrel-protein domain-containing protein-containing protein [Lentinula lateritia]
MFIKSLLFTALTFTAISEAIPLLPRTTYTGDVTYYTPGLGACGIVNTSAQLVAAIGHIAFDSYPNPICGKKVTASYGGHSVTVEIVDRCVGCAGEYDLDLSSTAFSELAPLSVGRLTGVTWEYVA